MLNSYAIDVVFLLDNVLLDDDFEQVDILAIQVIIPLLVRMFHPSRH